MDRKHILWSSQNENNILYKNLKNNEIMADVRKYFENLYDNLNSHGLKDKHFDKDFPNNVPGRWFELYIGNYLLNQNLKNLVANSTGPDFSFEIFDKKIWIECHVSEISNIYEDMADCIQVDHPNCN